MKLLELGKFYPPHRGGMETLLQIWCEGFAARGARVDCVVANDKAAELHETIGGTHVHRMAAYGSLLSSSLSPGYLRAPRRYPADVWHAHFPNPLADMACLAGPRQVPMLLSYHSDIIRQKRWLPIYSLLVSALLKRADRIVVASPNHLKYSRLLPSFANKVRCIPFGIDAARYRLTPGLKKKAEEFRGLAKGRHILLNVGRLVEYKGQRYLLEAVRDLDVAVWLVGTGPLEAPLRRLAHSLNISHRVIFWGGIADEDLLGCLHACDIFVLPSITANEAFGLVQLEAMACEKPVISCSLRSGVPYVNQDGVTGLTIEPGSASSLAEALRVLLSQPDRRKQLGQAGRVRVEREFAQERMLDEYWRELTALKAGSAEWS